MTTRGFSATGFGQALEEYGERVNYISITGVSNVTGIINPVRQLARLAHHYGALLVVDAAQMIAHLPIRMSGHENPDEDIDVLVFSGHKIYAPGSPGVVVARQELFCGVEPQEVGRTADLMDISLMKCQMGIFGFKPNNKIIKAEDTTDQSLKDALIGSVENNRLSCKKAWQIANQFNISKLKVCNVSQANGIQIGGCQLGAF